MDDVEARVISVIRLVIDRKNVKNVALSPSSAIDSSLGIDSLDLAEIVVRLEREFGRDPFGYKTPTIRSIQDLANLYR